MRLRLLAFCNSCMSSIVSLASAAVALTNSRASSGELLAAYVVVANPRGPGHNNISIIAFRCQRAELLLDLQCSVVGWVMFCGDVIISWP